MKRLPTFGHIKFYYVTEVVPEGEEPKWMTEYGYEIVDYDKDSVQSWLDDVKGNLDNMPDFNFELRKMRNVDYMKKHVIDQPFDDLSNRFVDEECPECSHLLVMHSDNGKFCSNHDCPYMDEDFRKYKESFKVDRSAPPSPKFREAGQTIEEFMEKYGFKPLSEDLDRCVECNERPEVSDFYRTKSGAFIEYLNGHAEDCTNKGPCQIRPLGDFIKRNRDALR